MVIKSEKILKISNFLLFSSLIVFNILNFLDKFTTYFGMKLGFTELNNRAVYFFANYGVLQGILLQFFVAMVGSVVIYFALVKSLRFLVVYIPTLLAGFYVVVSYMIAVVSNIYYLVAR